MILHQHGKSIFVDHHAVVAVTPGIAADDTPIAGQDITILLLTSGHEVWCDELTDEVIKQLEEAWGW